MWFFCAYGAIISLCFPFSEMLGDEKKYIFSKREEKTSWMYNVNLCDDVQNKISNDWWVLFVQAVRKL